VGNPGEKSFRAVGSCCSEEERISLIECLLSLNHIFALSEEESDLVEHVIDTGQAKPTRNTLEGCHTLYELNLRMN